MNPLLTLSAALAGIASVPSLSAAGDAIDFPDPGYREQIGRHSAPADRIAPVQPRVTRGIVVSEWPRQPEPGYPYGIFSAGYVSNSGRAFFSLPYLIQTTPALVVSQMRLILEATGNAEIYDWQEFTPLMVWEEDLSQGTFELCTWRLTCRIMHPQPEFWTLVL